GPDSDERFLKDLAKRGDGRYYPLLDARNLPRIFTKETFLAATKSVIEDPFTPAPGESHPIIQGFPFAASQPLLGYNATTKKPLATVSMTAPSGDPLLVHWNYGLGKSMAWTSDAKNRWAAAWMGWAPAQGLWTQAVRWLVGEQESKQLVANISREGTRTTISVDSFAPDGSLDPQGEVTAHIIMPNLEVREIPLRQVAPGRFEVTAEFPDVGDYLVNLIKEGAAEAVGVHTGFSVSYSPEYAAGPLNTFLLTRVAETTAGAFNPEPALVYRPVEIGAEGINWRDWTKPFLTLLILLFPLDIAMRRIMLPEEGFRVWWDAAMAGLLAVVRPAEAAARVRMGQGAAVAARWQRVAEQRVITDEQMNRRRRAGTPTIGATGTEEPPRPSAGSGDLQNRVERILSGGGGERRQRAPEDDTYEKLLEAKRRARRD
ncbi:MAG TPA: glutamine amidotransferase, partial [bacterium]|nr:glutamine amidotransferase [bacterium]